MSNLRTRGLTGVGCGVAVALLLALGLPFYDAVCDSPYRARDMTCRANLRQIGAVLASYRAAHGGAMPPSLKSLVPTLGTQTVLLCPVSGTVASPVYTQRSYTYRRVSQSRPRNIVAWDTGPHVPGHSVFVWLNRPCRHVLYADGRVGTVPEAQFAGLGLRGACLILSHQ